MSTILLYALGISIVLNFVVYLIAFTLQTDKLTDMTYSLSYICIALTALYYSAMQTAHIIIVVVVVLWAIRLGGFLMRRVHAIGRDDRFDTLRPHALKFLGFWTMQALTCFIVSLSVLLVLANAEAALTPIFIIGIGVALLGLAIETIADNQKYSFKNRHPDTFMQQGLWANIKHPNYTGEILFWIGLAVAALSSPYGYFALLSPLWISFILIRFSGIPLLRDKWEARYGQRADFQEYKKNSWYLFPYIY